MLNGDISNETSIRLVVVVDAVAKREESTTRKGLFSKEKTTSETTFDLAQLSRLWNIGNKYGLAIELIGFGETGWTQEELEEAMDTLDRRGLNPFNYAEVYTTVSEFVSYLPYRPNLHGVVDIPSRLLRYGSYGIQLDTL